MRRVKIAGMSAIAALALSGAYVDGASAARTLELQERPGVYRSDGGPVATGEFVHGGAGASTFSSTSGTVECTDTALGGPLRSNDGKHDELEIVEAGGQLDDESPCEGISVRVTGFHSMTLGANGKASVTGDIKVEFIETPCTWEGKKGKGTVSFGSEPIVTLTSTLKRSKESPGTCASKITMTNRDDGMYLALPGYPGPAYIPVEAVVEDTTATKATASFLKGDEQCGENTGGEVIGKAKFERLANTVSIRGFNLVHAEPGVEYQIQLWRREPEGGCEDITYLGSFNTNDKGSYSDEETLSATVPKEDTEFFATVTDGAGYDDTTSVLLP
jgi:hypothetical protein